MGEVAEVGGLRTISNFDTVGISTDSFTQFTSKVVHARVNALVTQTVEHSDREFFVGLDSSQGSKYGESFHY
jgi:hypothetical protein